MEKEKDIKINVKKDKQINSKKNKNVSMQVREAAKKSPFLSGPATLLGYIIFGKVLLHWS